MPPRSIHTWDIRYRDDDSRESEYRDRSEPSEPVISEWWSISIYLFAEHARDQEPDSSREEQPSPWEWWSEESSTTAYFAAPCHYKKISEQSYNDESSHTSPWPPSDGEEDAYDRECEEHEIGRDLHIREWKRERRESTTNYWRYHTSEDTDNAEHTEVHTRESHTGVYYIDCTIDIVHIFRRMQIKIPKWMGTDYLRTIVMSSMYLVVELLYSWAVCEYSTLYMCEFSVGGLTQQCRQRRSIRIYLSVVIA